MPKVLIADKLSPAAVEIFENRGLEVDVNVGLSKDQLIACLLYTSPSPRDQRGSRMPSSA